MTARSLLKQLIPAALRAPLDKVLRPLFALPHVLRIMLMKPVADGKLYVFYGRRRIPSRSVLAVGGIVKTQLMQEDFPNSPRRFNILYFVSSRMPYDAVQVAWCARKKGVRLVWNQNGVAYPAWHGPGWEAINAPMAILHGNAEYVFYQSQFCRLSAERYLGKREGPCEVLYNSVDTEAFRPAQSDPDPKHLVLLLAGTQYQYYRLACALQVLAEVIRRRPDARLLITGRLCWIPDEAEAGRIARRLTVQLGVQDRVVFLGSYAQTDAPDVFRQAHLLLHTKYNDPCPGAVIEAMACGLPVVYSDSGGVPELVGQNAGIGIPVERSWEKDIPPDPHAMAAAVWEVAERRTEFSTAARQRAVEKFDVRPWLQRHREVFEKVVR